MSPDEIFNASILVGIAIAIYAEDLVTGIFAGTVCGIGLTVLVSI
jgi:hypothetical protein